MDPDVDVLRTKSPLLTIKKVRRESITKFFMTWSPEV